MIQNRSGKNVLVLTYWSYRDALVQTYTLPYVHMIRGLTNSTNKIYLVTLEKTDVSLDKELSNTRLIMRQKGIDWMPFSYANFGLKAQFNAFIMIFRLSFLIYHKRIGVIHTWCTPAGGIGYILSLFTGKPLILDSYEPHAEPMLEAGQWSKQSLSYRILWWLERKQSQRAETVVACVPEMVKYAHEKYKASFEHFFWKPAAVDTNLFHPTKRKNPELVNKYGLEGKTVYVYAGKFGGSYLTREVFDLLRVASEFYKDQFRVVLLNQHSPELINEWAIGADLDPSVIIHRFLPHQLVPDYMGLGDVGLVPFVPVSSKRFGSPIKTGEYMAMGIPMIISSNISNDSNLIQKEGMGFVLEDWSETNFEQAVLTIDKMLADDSLTGKIRNIALREKTFDKARETYARIYL